MAAAVSGAVSAIIAVGKYIGGSYAALSAGTATVAQIATVAATQVGLMAASQVLLSPKIGGFGQSPLEWTANADAGLPFIVGEYGRAGDVVYASDGYGPDNRFTSIVSAYTANGPVESWGSYTLDELAVSFTGEALSSGPSLWQGNVYRSRRDGGASDTALASPAGLEGGASVPEWGANNRLPGLACDMLTLRGDNKNKRFASGEPLPFQSGIRAPKWSYDPRLDSTYPGGDGPHRRNDKTTWGWNNDPFIQGLNFTAGYWSGNGFGQGRLIGGIGNDWDSIDVASFVEAANIAEANGWTIGGFFRSSDARHEVLAAMLQAGGGIYANPRGRVGVICRGAVKASLATVTYEDIAGDIEIGADVPFREKINAAVARCPLPANRYEATDLEPVVVDDFVTEDGGRRERRIDMPMVPDVEQGSQLAAYAIVNSRERISGRVPLMPWMRGLQPGDCFTFATPGLDLDGVKVMVMQGEWDFARQVWTVSFVSETDAKHAFALGIDPATPQFSGLTPGNPFEVPAPDGTQWSAAPGQPGNPGIRIIGADLPAMISGVWIEYALDDDGAPGGWVNWYRGAVTEANYDVTGLDAGAQYWIAIRYANQLGYWQGEAGRLILGPFTASGVIADDAKIPSQNLAELLAGLSADAETAAEAAQALIDAIKADGSTPADVTAALESAKERLDAARQRADDATIRTERLEPPNGNLIFDPALTLGPADWQQVPGSQPFTTQTGAHRALLMRFEPSGSGATVRAIYRVRRAAVPGERIEVGAEMDVEGPADSLRVELVSYDSGGSAISTQTLALDAGYVRGHAFLFLPANTAEIEWRYAADSTAAGAVTVTARKPVWRKAAADQADPTPWSDERAASLSALIVERIASARIVSDNTRLLLKNGDLRAKYDELVLVSLGEDAALVGRVVTLEAANAALTSRIETLETVAFDGDLIAIAEKIDRLSVSAASINAMPNADLVAGPQGWTGSPHPPHIVTEDGRRALVWNGPAAASGLQARWRFDNPFRVLAGQKVEFSAAIKASGVASVSLRVVWFDAAGTEGSTQEIATGAPASFTRTGSYDVTAPADGFFRVEIGVMASGVGAGRLLAGELVVTSPVTGQSALTPFVQARQSRESAVLERQVAQARQASTERHLIHEAAGLSARISQESVVREQADSVLAQQATQIIANYQAADAALQGQVDAKAAITYVDNAISGVTGAIATSASEITAAYQAADAALQEDIDTRATATAVTEAIATETEARVSAINTLTTSVSGVNATATSALALAQSVDGKTTGLAGIQFDLDGRITSAILMDDGTTRSMNFGVDALQIEGAQRFEFNTETGEFSAPTLVVQLLKANTVETTNIVSDAINKLRGESALSLQTFAPATETTIITKVFEKDIAGSSLMIQFFCQMRGASNTPPVAFRFRVRRNGVLLGNTREGFTFSGTGADGDFSTFWQLDGVPAGEATFTISADAYLASASAGILNAEMSIQEIKR